jgi:hypothetical protein
MFFSRFGGSTALVDDPLSNGSAAPSSRFCVVEVASSDGLVVISYAYPFDSGLNHAALTSPSSLTSGRHKKANIGLSLSWSHSDHRDHRRTPVPRPRAPRKRNARSRRAALVEFKRDAQREGINKSNGAMTST